jgi:RNA polymerase sigma factor (sigma-70 family)
MMATENKEAFLNQLEKHKLIVYKICNVYCRNASDRDDLAQEILYQLWKSYHRYNGSVKFSTWMYRVALNVAISFYRAYKHNGHIVQLQEPHTGIADKNDSTDLEKDINALLQFITQLKELDRALMILHLEENSYAEIAEILGITETNVATRISRIKNKLKQHFLTINK